ncbi:O-antigen ligase family protein [Desulfosoma sp.]
MNRRLSHPSPLLETIGVAALYTFAFTALLSTTTATAALWILVGLFLFKVPKAGFPAAQWLLWPWAALLGYLILRTIAASLDRPEWAAYHLDGLWGWARLLLFPAVAWWCGGDETRCRRLLGVALAGLVVGMMRAVDLHTLESAWQGMRTGFHLRIVAFGLYAGTFLWALVCFTPEFFQARRFKPFWIALWSALLLLLGQALFFTQSRGVVLGFGATALIITIVVFMTRTTDLFRPIPVSLKRGLIVFWALLIGITVVNRPLLEKRWNEEKDTFLHLKSFDFNQPAQDSTGYRAHLYKFAFEGILAGPIWGAGPASSKRFIQESGRETLKSPNWKGELQWWDHLHSTQLEILFHYGAVGAALWLWLYVALFFGVQRAWKQGALSLSLWLFSLASLIYLFLWALFDFRSLHPDWRFFWNFLIGLIASGPMFQSTSSSGKDPRP